MECIDARRVANKFCGSIEREYLYRIGGTILFDRINYWQFFNPLIWIPYHHQSIALITDSRYAKKHAFQNLWHLAI